MTTSSQESPQHENSKHQSFRRKWLVAIFVLVVGTILISPGVLMLVCSLVFGWITTLDNHIFKGNGTPTVPVAVWLALAGFTCTKVLLHFLARFSPIEPRGSIVASRTNNGERVDILRHEINSVLIGALIVLLAFFAVAIGPVLYYSTEIARVVLATKGSLDSTLLNRHRCQGILERFEYGRVTPTVSRTKSVSNAYMVAMIIRYRESEGVMSSSLADLVKQEHIQSDVLLFSVEEPLADPPLLMIWDGKLPLSKDLPILVRPLPWFGGIVVSMGDGSTRFMSDDEWERHLPDWVTRLEDKGISMPEFLK